ncbi:hypothetical protein RHMOL_Rhmol01G0325900 [Rhododendron molle]|uniref:Uncharacterized protein n=1 Tax=Rhododendron molle TaxID=49168 RepID=A0ACC0Q9D2_RHOML|nr:hypothetical protein RHMOL_Rhmol01G0325900 [Rhododendron molle]
MIGGSGNCSGNDQTTVPIPVPLSLNSSSNNRPKSIEVRNYQAALARLEALENDNPGAEMIEINSDDDASLDDEDQVYTKKQSKSTKRKTRQAKALENAKKAPRTFLELLHEANLESLPPHLPSYLRAAVGPPSSTTRRHFCTVCGFTAKYTCVRCGMRFCAIRCQNIHNDTRCLKFVA